MRRGVLGERTRLACRWRRPAVILNLSASGGTPEATPGTGALPGTTELTQWLDDSGMVATRNRMFASTQSLLARVTALVAVLGVLALVVLAASPHWHASLHEHEAAAESDHEHGAPVESPDHVCAVTLFAAGVLGLLVFCLLLLGRSLVRRVAERATDEVAAAYPRYWLVPAHAPPAV